MKSKSKLLITLLVAMAFVYGYTVGDYKIFPYSALHSLKAAVRPKKQPAPKPAANPDYRSGIFYSTLSIFESTETKPEIVMLGDSITQAGLWSEYLPGYEIANRGIGGDTTYGIIERIDEVVQRNAKFVFLLAGINDIDQRYTDSEIANNILKIASIVKDSGSTPIVQSILYVSDLDKSKRSNEQIAHINQLIADGCSNLEIQFLDITSITDDGELLTNDGLHLTGPAYVKWVDILKEFLDSGNAV